MDTMTADTPLDRAERTIHAASVLWHHHHITVTPRHAILPDGTHWAGPCVVAIAPGGAERVVAVLTYAEFAAYRDAHQEA